MARTKVLVVGAGASGLAAATALAVDDFDVTVLETATDVGGKMRQLPAGPVQVDAGPTVFTMHWVFEALFKRAGQDFKSAVPHEPASLLARHAWTHGGNLDLHNSVSASAEAIHEFAGAADAEGFRRFMARAANVYATLRDSFMAAQRPSMPGLVCRAGLSQMGALLRTAPHQTLWQALDRYFEDPRLQQLFGRYATYVGSSPLACPATLMLIAHVEQEGVWLLPGGMYSLAQGLRRLAEGCGVTVSCGMAVNEIQLRGGRVCGVELEDGTRLDADAVVFTGDCNAIAEGQLGADIATAVPGRSRTQRGLSAVTWCLRAHTEGFPLAYHNVFFDQDYPAEFSGIFDQRQSPEYPTVYVCAQDRLGTEIPSGPERLLVLINAPADGDIDTWPGTSMQSASARAWNVMGACGLKLDVDAAEVTATSPAEFNRLFPGSGGSLYGAASHGMRSSFTRPAARTRIPGLYLAGGTVHPGPGVPMTTLSGQLAAEALSRDFRTR